MQYIIRQKKRIANTTVFSIISDLGQSIDCSISIDIMLQQIYGLYSISFKYSVQSSRKNILRDSQEVQFFALNTFFLIISRYAK